MMISASISVFLLLLIALMILYRWRDSINQLTFCSNYINLSVTVRCTLKDNYSNKSPIESTINHLPSMTLTSIDAK